MDGIEVMECCAGDNSVGDHPNGGQKMKQIGLLVPLAVALGLVAGVALADPKPMP
jgi:hypothetical protein